jgi:hypothetical protein
MNGFKEGELVFQFHGARKVEKLDEEGTPKPSGMKLVDFVVEEDNRTLLIEIKDPSASMVPDQQRERYARKFSGNELISDQLVPKARSSYTYLHLMKRDSKPFLYVVVFGLERFPNEKALLMGFKDRLLQRIRHECKEPWKRQYIKDCLVVTLDSWNEFFKNYPLIREEGYGAT